MRAFLKMIVEFMDEENVMAQNAISRVNTSKGGKTGEKGKGGGEGEERSRVSPDTRGAVNIPNG